MDSKQLNGIVKKLQDALSNGDGMRIYRKSFIENGMVEAIEIHLDDHTELALAVVGGELSNGVKKSLLVIVLSYFNSDQIFFMETVDPDAIDRITILHYKDKDYEEFDEECIYEASE